MPALIRMGLALVIVAAFCVPALAQTPASAAAEPQATPAPTPAPASEKAAAVAAEPAAGPHCWLDQIKKPCPWVKLGGDLRMRENWDKNMSPIVGLPLDNRALFNERHYQRYRTRLWATVSPTKDLDFNVRATWEFFNFCEPAVLGLRDTSADEVIIDQANVQYRNTFGLEGNTLTVGRQDFAGPNGVGQPGFGDGWLILEGTPLDGSRTIFFDAIRDTIHMKDIKSSLDLVYLHVEGEENDSIRPFCDKDKYINESNQNGAIAYFKNNSIERTQIDAYYIFVGEKPALPNGFNDKISTLGSRVEHQFDKAGHWKARGEGAVQIGKRYVTDADGTDKVSLCAAGFNSRLTYLFKDNMNQQLRTGYEFLSGDSGGTNGDGDTIHQFYPVWGRYPQYSEISTGIAGRETGVPGLVTNMQRVYWGYSITPCKPVEVLLDYHLLFANQAYDNAPGFSDSNVFRGQLFTALMKYKFNDHVSGHLLGEMFCPGNFYTERNDIAFFVRYELTFTW